MHTTLTELPQALAYCPCLNTTGMLPPSTTSRPPTYPPGFHEPLQGANWGQGWTRPPPNTENGDVRITADDVVAASTTGSPHKSKTTTKPEFYEEDSIGRFLVRVSSAIRMN